jgi:hypothetical protein
MGVKKYGMHLQPFNGRDALWDAYQEHMDLIVYLRQAIYERDNQLKINATILKVAAQLLRESASAYSNHGCNDYELPNTPENMEFVRAMIAASDYPDDVPQLGLNDKNINFMDTEAMRFCANMLEEMAGQE